MTWIPPSISSYLIPLAPTTFFLSCFSQFRISPNLAQFVPKLSGQGHSHCTAFIGSNYSQSVHFRHFQEKGRFLSSPGTNKSQTPAQLLPSQPNPSKPPPNLNYHQIFIKPRPSTITLDVSFPSSFLLYCHIQLLSINLPWYYRHHLNHHHLPR